MREGIVRFNYKMINVMFGPPSTRNIGIILRSLRTVPTGYSEIKYPELLVESKATPREKLMYLTIAARRNPFDIIRTQDRSISQDLAELDWTEVDLQKNRLLRICSGRVYFYYEDKLNGY